MCLVTDGVSSLFKRSELHFFLYLFMYLFTSVHFILIHFPLLFPRLAISLFSRISVLCSGWSTVLDTIAFATTGTGTAMEVEQTAETAPKNLRMTHSPGRLSCLSTNKTLLEKQVQLGGCLILLKVSNSLKNWPRFLLVFLPYNIWSQWTQWESSGWFYINKTSFENLSKISNLFSEISEQAFSSGQVDRM